MTPEYKGRLQTLLGASDRNMKKAYMGISGMTKDDEPLKDLTRALNDLQKAKELLGMM